jgi:hypothetical protein
MISSMRAVNSPKKNLDSGTRLIVATAGEARRMYRGAFILSQAVFVPTYRRADIS